LLAHAPQFGPPPTDEPLKDFVPAETLNNMVSARKPRTKEAANCPDAVTCASAVKATVVEAKSARRADLILIGNASGPRAERTLDRVAFATQP